jgi:hypothetical protein
MPVSEALREAQKRYYNKIMSNPETKKVFLEKSKDWRFDRQNSNFRKSSKASGKYEK